MITIAETLINKFLSKKKKKEKKEKKINQSRTSSCILIPTIIS